ncbi:hypothetical protein HDV64DRAFT_194411 [Trichoderma sp. TUCIM 5745]
MERWDGGRTDGMYLGRWVCMYVYVRMSIYMSYSGYHSSENIDQKIPLNSNLVASISFPMLSALCST